MVAPLPTVAATVSTKEEKGWEKPLPTNVAATIARAVTVEGLQGEGVERMWERDISFIRFFYPTFTF